MRATLTARGNEVTARLQADGAVATSLSGSLHELVGALSRHGLEVQAAVVRGDGAAVSADAGGGQGAYPQAHQGGDGWGGAGGRDGRASSAAVPVFSLDAKA